MKKVLTHIHELDPLQFEKKIAKAIQLEFQKWIESNRKKSSEEWLTRKELVKLIKVSEVTIIDWDKKGILKPFRIGNRVRYRLTDIEKVLENSRV